MPSPSTVTRVSDATRSMRAINRRKLPASGSELVKSALLATLLLGAVYVSAAEKAQSPAASLPGPAEVSNRDAIKIAAVGDVMMGSTFPNETRMPPDDGKDL